jgi:hypothetical protein
MTTDRSASRPDRRKRATVGAVVLAMLVAVLAACTGVPKSSRPEVVKPLPAGGDVTQVPPARPRPNIGPHDLVGLFLSLNSLPTSNYASARNFLTPAQRLTWQDSTATVVDSETVGLYKPGKPIVVRGTVLGRISAGGSYQAVNSSTQTSFKFRIARVNGQYRISGPVPGLLLTESQFETAFTERNLYFYDLAQKYLVPDPRWTPLTDPTQLDEWLLTQLSDGPIQQLSNSVNTLPSQVSAARSRINVTEGTPTKIEIPGSSQLDRVARAQLAAEIASTLDDSDRRLFELTDGGNPVKIPSFGRAEFTAADFVSAAGPPQPAGDVYFVSNGKLFSGDNFETVKGEVNNGHFYLGSVALSRSDPTGELSVAGIAAVKGLEEELVVGTQAAGLRATSVRGELTRPAFAPGRDEVWVGGVGAAGAKIDLVDLTGRTPKVVPVGLPNSPGGQIISLRLSPEGSRIALVIKSTSGAQQLYIGSIVRGGGQVRVDTLTLISPPSVVVGDVGWIESTKLYAIGYTGSALGHHVYETDVDGSVWTAMGITGLPEPPNTFTVTPGQPAWAESEQSLWVQSGGSTWMSAGPTGQTAGRNPVYLG